MTLDDVKKVSFDRWLEKNHDSIIASYREGLIDEEDVWRLLPADRKQECSTCHNNVVVVRMIDKATVQHGNHEHSVDETYSVAVHLFDTNCESLLDLSFFRLSGGGPFDDPAITGVNDICSGPQGHDTRISASHCQRCGKDLCEICGADHATSEGHDLSDPRYWGV